MIAIKKLRERRAISPVIATVILVAVAITVAVGVSYWMSGIAGQYTSFEKVEIKSAYASRKYDSPTDPKIFQGWVVEFGVQNTGSSPATLDSLFVNDRPISEYGVSTIITDLVKIRWTDTAVVSPDLWDGWNGVTSTLGVSLESGDKATIYVVIYGDKSFISAGVPPAPDVFADGLFSAGTTINVKLHSAGGMDYIKLVRLS